VRALRLAMAQRVGADGELLARIGQVPGETLARGLPARRQLGGQAVRAEGHRRSGGRRSGVGRRGLARLLRGNLARSPYALRTASASWSPSRSTDASRILNFWTLPVIVIGNSSTKIT
jgi:hypothetical protein